MMKVCRCHQSPASKSNRSFEVFTTRKSPASKPRVRCVTSNRSLCTQGTHQEVHDTQEVRSTAIFPCRRFKKVGRGLCIRENRSRIFDEVDSTIRNTDNSPYPLCISSCVAYLLAEHIREYSSPDKGSTTPACRMAVLCVMP